MPKESKSAKLHHYIPQFYLKGFCDDQRKAQLYCVDKKARKSFISNVKNIASEKDFYKADIPNNPGIYENALAAAKAEHSKVLEQINKTSSLSNNLDQLLSFIAWLYVSNPGIETLLMEQSAKLIKY